MVNTLTAEQVRIQMVDKIIDAIQGIEDNRARSAIAVLALDLAKEYDLPRELYERVGEIVLLNHVSFGLTHLFPRIYRMAGDQLRGRIRDRLARLGWHNWLLCDPFVAVAIPLEELRLLMQALSMGSSDDGGAQVLAYAKQYYSKDEVAELDELYKKRKKDWEDLP